MELDADRVAAWEELYAALPHGWAVMRPVWRAEDRVWAIYAHHLSGPKHAVGPWREAFGQSEAIALRALAQQFRALCR